MEGGGKRSEGIRRVTLVRGEHRWVFECARGEEEAMARRVRDLAAAPGCNLDAFDAAVVCHHLGASEGARV